MRLHIPCARGTEKALAFELKDLGVDGAVEGRGVVHVDDGSEDVVARVNVFSRIAHRVLWEIASFENIRSEADVVDALMGVRFEDYLDERGTFAVDAHLHQCAWDNTHFAALRTKDCILDRLRAQNKGRPNVDKFRPAVRFVLHWNASSVSLSLDTSGDALHMRGYRAGVEGMAPMKETLAAAILAIGHAPPDRPFLDPCCGTGTLPIEQAMRALKIAPGGKRRFGFERWGFRTPALDRALALARTKAKDEQLTTLPAPIALSDWHNDAVSAATQAVHQAGLAAYLTPHRVDARQAPFPGERPVICANLPFGERLAQGSKNRLQLQGFYRTLGDRMRECPGARVLLFSSQPDTAALVGLDDVAKSRRWNLRSGDLEARLYRWDLPHPADLLARARNVESTA